MYITGIGNISPQPVFANDTFLEDIRSFDGNRLSCTEPDYKNFINPVQIRRMGRIVKMGISSAKMALADADVSVPDAIIVGSGLGCLEDTEKFLATIHESNEQMAAPTAFISSTHNSVAGAIALQLKCFGYNYTYVHKGFSFVSCLYDAALQIKLSGASHVLVGGIDEMTDQKYTNLALINGWNLGTPNTLDVYNNLGEGRLAGEGSAFFVLSSNKTANTYARIEGFRQFYSEAEEDVSAAFAAFLEEHGLRGERFVLLEGKSGDTQEDRFYPGIEKLAGEKNVHCTFKHLCGSYDTSDAFALSVAAHILRSEKISDVLNPSFQTENIPQTVVVYDHVNMGEHVFMILSR